MGFKFTRACPNLDDTCRCLSIQRVVATVLLAFNPLLSTNAQGSTGDTSDLSSLGKLQSEGRNILAAPSHERAQQIKERVRRYRRKATPKHKRRQTTNLSTESFSKDGKIDQWTRTHSVSRLGPRRVQKKNTKPSTKSLPARRPKNVKSGPTRGPTRRPASQHRQAGRSQRPKEASRIPQAPPRKRARSAPPPRRTPSARREESQTKAAQTRASAQEQRAQTRDRVQTSQPRTARRPAARKAHNGNKDQGFHWRGKGQNGFKWNPARRLRPHRIPWKGKVVYDDGDVICVASSEQDRIATETRSAEIHSQAGMSQLMEMRRTAQLTGLGALLERTDAWHAHWRSGLLLKALAAPRHHLGSHAGQ